MYYYISILINPKKLHHIGCAYLHCLAVPVVVRTLADLPPFPRISLFNTLFRIEHFQVFLRNVGRNLPRRSLVGVPVGAQPRQSVLYPEIAPIMHSAFSVGNQRMPCRGIKPLGYFSVDPVRKIPPAVTHKSRPLVLCAISVDFERRISRIDEHKLRKHSEPVLQDFHILPSLKFRAIYQPAGGVASPTADDGIEVVHLDVHRKKPEPYAVFVFVRCEHCLCSQMRRAINCATPR